MKRRFALKGLASALVLTAVFAPAAQAAAENYPSRPITIVVPYPPGGVTDQAARLVAEVLTDKFGQSVVVENRPGANGLIGQQRVADAAPDGYTLMLNGLGGNVIPPATIQGLPLDIPKAFVPIAEVAEFVNVLIVGDKSPYKSAKDLANAAKEKGPESFSFGSNGVGTSSHLTSEFFAQTAGVKMLHVPYKGGAEILVDVVNGNLDLSFNNLPSVLGLISKGSVRPLAVTSSYRSDRLPNVPTMQEEGFADFNVTSWLGIYGPAGMPQAIVDKLGNAIAEGVAKPKTSDKLKAAGFEPKPGNAQAFAQRNSTELARWTKIAKEANVSLKFGGNQ